MGLRLRSGISFCIINERAFFLDCPLNRYFCLPPKLNKAFLRLTLHEAETVQDSFVQTLQQRGLIIEYPGPNALQACEARTPESSALRAAPSAPLSLYGSARAVYQILRCETLLNSTSFEQTLAIIPAAREKSRRSVISVSDPAVATVIRTFLNAGRILGSHDKCLRIGLALALELLRQGASAQLVFGVNPSPFHAHCWVQIGDVAVFDELESLKPYTPILVL